MINETLYNKTVNILVDAYFNDTLEHGNQCGCAVGNMVAANMGIVIKKEVPSEEDGYEGIISYWFDKYSQWKDASWYAFIKRDREDYSCFEYDHSLAKKQIRSTGYSYYELAKIEKAFESAIGKSIEDRRFNGLMAVVEILDEIHENKNPEVSTASKKRFERGCPMNLSLANKLWTEQIKTM